MKITLVATVWAAILLGAAPAIAVPNEFTVQGVLRDQSGRLQSMPVQVTVRLYDDQTSADPGNLREQFGPTEVVAENGLFTVAVPVTDLGRLVGASSLWLEVTAGNDTFPRQRVTSELFALSCAIARSFSADAVEKPHDLPDSELQSGWTSYGAGFTSAAYFKDPFGIVHLEGLVRVIGGAVLTKPSPIFVLPPGYRPAKTGMFAVATYPAAADSPLSCWVNVAPDGNVSARERCDARFVSLDGITFRALGADSFIRQRSSDSRVFFREPEEHSSSSR
jgi:hypothetical protein